MLDPNTVHIWRDADDDCYIEWSNTSADTKVVMESLSGGSVAESLSPHGRVIGARVSGLRKDRTHLFRLQDQFGTQVIVSERRLGMQGTPNFRDFGGYSTADGRRVKWGSMFRSGQLSELTNDDVILLSSLRLDLVCDFRRVEEQEAAPNRLPSGTGPKVLSLPITPGSNANFFEQAGSSPAGREAMFNFMVEINRDFAVAQTATYARMFSEILELDEARFLVHCAAGKDRTGFAAAIILLALGVEWPHVLHDYMMSARYFSPQHELDRIRAKYKLDIPAESIMPMLEVHESYLLAAMTEILSKYGSVEAYLSEELGVGKVELEELRRRYLERDEGGS